MADTQPKCAECARTAEFYNKEPKPNWCKCGAVLGPEEKKQDGFCQYCGSPRMFIMRKCPDFIGSYFNHDEEKIFFILPNNEAKI